MAQNKGSSPVGLIIALIVVALVTIGGVTGVAYINWPSSGPDKQAQGDKLLEALAKSAGMVSTKILLDYSDPMEQQFALEKAIKDLKAVFPEVGQVWVLDDKNTVIYSTKAADIEKPYQAPSDIKIPNASAFFVAQAGPDQRYISTPLKLQDKVVGGLRLMVSQPQTKASAGNRNLVIIAGAVALILGIILPVVLVNAMGGGGARPAAAVPDANTLRALKAEEASINARLEAARKELARADELKSQQNFIESQIEAMRRLQAEEAEKLEALRREAAKVSATPQLDTASLSQQDQELLQKIEGHRKEEMLLARKIEEIRKKVIDLDRRIEARRKEEAEIGVRIEAKKREEQALNQRMGG